MLVQEWHTPGTDPGYQVMGDTLEKIAPNGGRRENVWVFRVKNHDFTQKKIIFFPILGGAHAGSWIHFN